MYSANTVTVIARGMAGPVGIAADAGGNMFVTDWWSG